MCRGNKRLQYDSVQTKLAYMLDEHTQIFILFFWIAIVEAIQIDFYRMQGLSYF